jgi:hypothetical protein
MSKSDEYTRNVEECSRMASSAKSAEEQNSWLRLADSWRRMLRMRCADEAVAAREDLPSPR